LWPVKDKVAREVGFECGVVFLGDAVLADANQRLRQAIRYNPRVMIVGPLLGYLWLKELSKR